MLRVELHRRGEHCSSEKMPHRNRVIVTKRGGDRFRVIRVFGLRVRRTDEQCSPLRWNGCFVTGEKTDDRCSPHSITSRKFGNVLKKCYIFLVIFTI